jgi:hypothetical protein
MGIILMLTINTVFSINIGLISNAKFIASNNGQTFSNMTCTQCACAALMTSSVGWNCMTINYTCDLIKNYSSTDIGLIMSMNATFFFQQLPLEPASMSTNPMTTSIFSTYFS